MKKKKKFFKRKFQSKKTKKVRKKKVTFKKRKTKKVKKKKVIFKKRKIKVIRLKKNTVKKILIKKSTAKLRAIKIPKFNLKKIKFFKFKLKKKIVKKISIKQPIDRLRAIRIPKFKLKKIKFKLKKKYISKIQKKVSGIVIISFRNTVNFILTPAFKTYDNYFENKKIKQLEKIEREQKEKVRHAKEEERLSLLNKQLELKNEEKLARERSQDLKNFIRHEQAILRHEQSEKRHRFLEKIKLEKKIESFRKRELQEIMSLEKLALKEQREDYRGVELRLENIKEKYRLIREQKIRERVESLGVEISDTDTKEDILQKEKEYAHHRHTIELVLESFYRSANSLVFQLNKKFLPKHKSILRTIDRRYESNECFIRYDDSPDEDWLILIYLEDSDAQKGKIIVENKANPEKHETKSFETKEIFTYSDYLVDVMTAHIDRERQKK